MRHEEDTRVPVAVEPIAELRSHLGLHRTVQPEVVVVLPPVPLVVSTHRFQEVLDGIELFQTGAEYKAGIERGNLVRYSFFT